MKSKLLLAACLTLLLSQTAFSAEYLLRLEYVSAPYDEETDIGQLLSKIELRPLEVKLSEGGEFEAQLIDGNQQMSLKGELTRVEDRKLNFQKFAFKEEHENGGSSASTSLVIELDKVQFTSGGGTGDLMNWCLVSVWELPLDEKTLASKRKKFEEDRIDFVRNKMLEQRQEAFAKEKAAASLLALAQRHFAAGEFRVSELVLKSFSFGGTEVEEQAAQLRRSLHLQGENDNGRLPAESVWPGIPSGFRR